MANGETLTGNGDWKMDEVEPNAESMATDWKPAEADATEETASINWKPAEADATEETPPINWSEDQPDRNSGSFPTVGRTGQPDHGAEGSAREWGASRPGRNSANFNADWKTTRLDRNAMEKFISTVKLYPVLYDMDMEGYKDLEMKETIWKEVAAQCNFKSERDAKHHWKKVRDCLREALKRQQYPVNPRTGRRKRNWKYQRQLDFLKPFLTQRLGQQQPDLPDRVMNPPPRMLPGPAPAVREPMEPEVPPQNQSDVVLNFLARQSAVRQGRDKHPLELFFASMCESTKNLAPALQAKVKGRLFEAVSQAEAEQQNSRWGRDQH